MLLIEKEKFVTPGENSMAFTTAEFAAHRNAIARTFGEIQGIPIPAALPNHTYNPKPAQASSSVHRR